MSWTQIFSAQDIEAGQPKTYSLTTPKGCSIVVHNQSPYAVQITTSTGAPVDVVPGHHSLTMPYEQWQSLVFTLDPTQSDGISYGPEYVAVRMVSGTVTYQRSPVYPAQTSLASAIQAIVQGLVQAEITNSSLPVTIGNAQINTNVVNEYVSDNSLVPFNPRTTTVSNLANGATKYFINTRGPVGCYDGIVIEVISAGGYKYTITDHGAWRYLDGTHNFKTANAMLGTQVYGSNNETQVIGYFPDPVVFDTYAFDITNASGATIVNDTVTIYMFAIKASVGTSLAPAQTQTVFQKSSRTDSWSISSQSIPAGGASSYSYTGSFPAAQVKRVQVYAKQTSSSGLAGGTAYVSIDVFASQDGSTWYYAGMASSISQNGASNVAFDSSAYPILIGGYQYIRFGLRIQNVSGSSITASSSGTIYIDYQI
ncbi:MAG: hypothetical protein IRZ03_16425 [Acidobacterium ailaaui]|nr:hypothetical protein [Pseudacidobacterium ailaaui]